MADSRRRRVRFLHPIEHALLREWLSRFELRASEDVEPPPAERGVVDWRAALEFDEDEWDEARLGVRPKYSAALDARHALDNAVARLCLEDVREELPSLMYSRRAAPARRGVLRAAPMRSRHLLSINWCDPAAHEQHFVAYYSTYSPYYECRIVSASSYLVDPKLGYHDVALFAHGPELDLLAGARETLIGEWRRFAPRVARFVDFGVVDGPLATAWAERARS